MQGQNAAINIVTIPPGAGLGQRIVLDGLRGAIFEYDASNHLVGSWASKAGTDPYGNAYPAGFDLSGGSIIGPEIISPLILGYASTTPRGPYNESFESGTGGWTGTNGSVSQSSVWASVGNDSLLLTANGSGDPSASSPAQACTPGDPVSVSIDLFAPAPLTNVYVGVQWQNASHTVIGETDCLDTAFTGGQITTLTVGDTAPANAAFYVTVFGDHAVDPLGTLLYGDNVQASGNLAFSAAVQAGTDQYGNEYNQGIDIAALNGLTSTFTLTDAWGNVLYSIDANGNVSAQTFFATSDIFLAGQSMNNDILPPLSGGVIFRTNVLSGQTLPFPASPTTSQYSLFELDMDITGGRDYVFVLAPIRFQLNGPGRVNVTIFYTNDGTTPSTSSNVWASVTAENDGTLDWVVETPPSITEYSPSLNKTYRFLVAASTTSTTSSGKPGWQIIANGFNDGGFFVIDGGSATPDTGIWIGSSGGGGGTSPKNYTKNYFATQTYSYAGSDGTFPNTKLSTGTNASQGGDVSDTFNGKTKSWLVFDHATIASDLSGATINKVYLRLRNKHSWYNSGMTVALGWSTKSSFGSTASDPSGADIDLIEYSISEGATLTKNIGTQFGTAFQSGGATSLVLFKNSNNLKYYGYFAGANESTEPELIIEYTK